MSGNSSSSGAIYLGIAFALIGVLMLTIFYFGTAGSRRFFREGESVLGTVVDVDTWTVGRDRNYRTTIELQSE